MRCIGKFTQETKWIQVCVCKSEAKLDYFSSDGALRKPQKCIVDADALSDDCRSIAMRTGGKMAERGHWQSDRQSDDT